MASRRMIITMSEEDRVWLEGYSKAHKVSIADAIRQGIKRLKESQGRRIYEKVVKETRGLWKKGDGLKYQRKLRSEWESR